MTEHENVLLSHFAKKWRTTAYDNKSKAFNELLRLVEQLVVAAGLQTVIISMLTCVIDITQH